MARLPKRCLLDHGTRYDIEKRFASSIEAFVSDTTHFRWKDDLLYLQVRVTPKSARDQVREVSGDRLKIAITAAPTDGKANRHLIKWLADQFGVPAMRVSITSGLGARDKTVCVERPGRLPAQFHVTRPGPAS